MARALSPELNLRGRLSCSDVSSLLPALLRGGSAVAAWEGGVLKVEEDAVRGVENHPEIAAHTPCHPPFTAGETAGAAPGKARAGSECQSSRRRGSPRTLRRFTLCLRCPLRRAHLSTDAFLLPRMPSFPTKEVPKCLLHALILCEPPVVAQWLRSPLVLAPHSDFIDWHPSKHWAGTRCSSSSGASLDARI